jgi:hypothetical protein
VNYCIATKEINSLALFIVIHLFLITLSATGRINVPGYINAPLISLFLKLDLFEFLQSVGYLSHLDGISTKELLYQGRISTYLVRDR